ncbi:MAG: hypothetical protein SFV15_14415 [Polyangiaceae bacterium]|nr:hypothetical protein [Polyangiaceae bacterium]
MQNSNSSTCLGLLRYVLAGAALLYPGVAWSQEQAPAATATATAEQPPAEPPTPPAATETPATTEPPPKAAEPPPEAPAAATPEATPPPPAEVKPPEEEKFPITTGFGFRAGARAQDLKEPDSVNGFSFDALNVEARFGGKVTPIVGWTANFTVEGRTATTLANSPPAPPAGPPVVFEARAMDLIGQLDFKDEFHVWIGRMLTPSDRSNFSGPWFIGPWEYPGVYSIPGKGFAYIGPRGTEEIGREVGTVVWGDINKGKFKYYAGAMDLDDAPANSPLWTGRVQYAIVGSEPGFYGSSTYYGSQNIVAIGAAAQYQKRLSTAAVDAMGMPTVAKDDVTEINADILAEYNVGGTVSFEGAYYHMDTESSLMPADDAFFVVGSYLLPNKIGIGKPQVGVRYQATMGPDMSMMEGFLAYVIKDYFAKMMLTFEHTDMGKGSDGAARKGNAVRLGFQIQQ